jgi:hypothetical protein
MGRLAADDRQQTLASPAEQGSIAFPTHKVVEASQCARASARARKTAPVAEPVGLRKIISRNMLITML